MNEKLNNFWYESRKKLEKYLSYNPSGSYEKFSPLKALTYKRLKNIFTRELGGNSFKVLEIGCGSGLILSYFTEGGIFCVGIDISQEAHNYARLISGHKNLTLNLLQSNYQSYLPFKDNSFDIVFSNGTIEHESLEIQRFMIQEMKRVSKNLISHSIPNPRGVFRIFEREVIGKTEPDYSIEEKEINLRKLFHEFNLEIILEDGLLIYTDKSRLREQDQNIYEFYNRIRFNIPEDYSAESLTDLVSFEEGISSKDRIDNGFLNLLIAKKVNF